HRLGLGAGDDRLLVLAIGRRCLGGVRLRLALGGGGTLELRLVGFLELRIGDLGVGHLPVEALTLGLQRDFALGLWLWRRAAGADVGRRRAGHRRWLWRHRLGLAHAGVRRLRRGGLDPALGGLLSGLHLLGDRAL